MNDFTKIIDNYKEVSPCLLKISENIKNFQRIEHSVIFTYLFCYFSNKNISVEDLSNIFNFYKKDIFNTNNFFDNFKKISFIFSNYFSKKNDSSNIEEGSNNINNNSHNNYNFINNSNNLNMLNNDNKNFTNNRNQNNNNNNSPKNNQYSIFSINNDESQNIFNSNNNNYLNNSNSMNFVDNSNINNNFNFRNNQYNNISNNNSNMFNFNPNNKGSQFQYNSLDEDYQLAKQIEEEERVLLQIQSNKDGQKQNKKCEICLEDFSLLDCTNYFLNCNCIIHNKCFDELVKNAVESNNLPIKCPNCGINVHPNFIEDSINNANPQLLSKYDKFSMNNFLQNNSDEYSSCPTPGCEYMFFFEPGAINFLCPLCGKNYCLNCKDEWHRGMTCQQYKDSRDVNKLDNQFFQFVKGAKFKMCPKCKFWVEKNQGCNHMKCRCGADFCYLCGEFMDMSRSHKCKNK